MRYKGSQDVTFGEPLTTVQCTQMLQRKCKRCGCCCRAHAYGDVYSSPGLDLRQKQLLAAAFLVRPPSALPAGSVVLISPACCRNPSCIANDPAQDKPACGRCKRDCDGQACLSSVSLDLAKAAFEPQHLV